MTHGATLSFLPMTAATDSTLLALLQDTEHGQTLVRALGHHAVLLLLLQITVLLAIARLLGEIMRKLNLPPVIGELSAGVLLGPSLLGAAAPDFQTWLFPREQHQSDLLAVVSWIGVLFLLVITGLETDIGLIKRRGKGALVISAGGIMIPFATGLGLGALIPETYLANPDNRLVFALFMAVAMSISAVPVIAKVLMDLKLIRRDIGQLILAAAMTDDTVGWLLLSVVAGLATAGTVDLLSILETLGGAVLFLALAFTVGAPIVTRVISTVDRLFGGDGAQLSLVLVLGLGAASLTHAMGIEAVLGAFAIGILIGQAPRFRRNVGHTLELITTSFLAPVFFASAGVKVDLARLLDQDVFFVGVVVLAIACFGKFVGAYLGSWAAGLSHWERLAMGSGMNARGAMEIVVATMGLGLGVLTVEMYSIIVMVAIVTSLMAPPLLRWTLGKVKVGHDEAKRLEREEMAANSFVRGMRRALLVARSVMDLGFAAQLTTLMSREQPMEATAVYARRPAVRWHWWNFWSRRLRRFNNLAEEAAQRIRSSLQSMTGPRAEVKIVTDDHPAEIILGEAAKGYDVVLVVDPMRTPTGQTLFGNMIDEIIRSASKPRIVVKTPRTGIPKMNAWAPRKILVPTVGTEHSRNAMEVASVLGAGADALVTLVHVSRTNGGQSEPGSTADLELGKEIVETDADRARKLGARIETIVIEANSPDEKLLKMAADGNYDLIVMGTNLRGISARAFFGHRVEAILRNAKCPVAVVTG